MLDRVELRFRFLNRVHYILDARIQIVKGISSRINNDYNDHRILWDLDNCEFNEALEALNKIQDSYNLGKIYIFSDKEKSYGAICNTVVSFREYLKILIDTDLIDPLFTRYALQRHEGILRLSNKEGRPLPRETIHTIHSESGRLENHNDFVITSYETGYIKRGIRSGNFYNDQKEIYKID